MTTDSHPKKLVLLFSAKASENYKTFSVRMENGDVHQYNMILNGDRELDAGRKIIPYFHDSKVVAEVETAQIALSRGSNERPEIGQLVKLPEPVTARYHESSDAKPASRRIMKNHM